MMLAFNINLIFNFFFFLPDSQFSCSNASSPSHDNQDSSSQDANHQISDVFKASRKTNAQITKQLVQETLMDEGLRVVKELASQIKENSDNGNMATSPNSQHEMVPQHQMMNNRRSSPPLSMVQNQISPMSLTNHHHQGPIKSQPNSVMSPSGSNMSGQVDNCSMPVQYNHVNQDAIQKCEIDKNIASSYISDGCIRNNTENTINNLLNLQTKGNGIKQEPGSPTSLHH